MNRSSVVDTNVAVVANGKAPHAGVGCVRACVDALVEIQSRGRLLLDDCGEILIEYRRHLSPSGQPGVGDAFFKWLWSNQANPERCRKVSINPVAEPRCFEEFPAALDLSNFDPSDRKFVAVAIASGENPPILNAVDSDWWTHREPLRRQGVEVRFLCPELMKAR